MFRGVGDGLGIFFFVGIFVRLVGVGDGIVGGCYFVVIVGYGEASEGRGLVGILVF